MTATFLPLSLLPRARRGNLALVPRDDDELADQLLQQRLKARLFGEASAPVTVGGYRLDRRLGEGGMGVVYRAHDPKLDRSVALKLMHPTVRGASERIRGEARALARLAHPNVVPVFEIGEHDGQLFVAMELVEGVTLRTWLEGQVVRTPAIWRRALALAPRGLAAVLDCFLQAARGLQAAHAAGIVHRDFKPDNVLVGADGRVRVVDFGISSHAGAAVDEAAAVHAVDAPLRTRTGELAGTPAYMAPEQLSGGHVDARSDQFALCVALYEAVCGARPFAGDTVATLMGSVCAGELRPAPRWLPAGLRAALQRGLQRDPARRWPDMAALISALERAARPRAPVVAAGALAGLGLAWVALAAPVAAQPVLGDMSQGPGGPTLLQRAWAAAPAVCLPEPPVTDRSKHKAEMDALVAEARKHAKGSPEDLTIRAKLAGRLAASGDDPAFACQWAAELLVTAPPAAAERLRCLQRTYCAAPKAVTCPAQLVHEGDAGCVSVGQCQGKDQVQACAGGDAACCTSALIVREYEQLEANTAALPASRAELLALARQGCTLGVAMHCEQAAGLGGEPRATLLRRACELGRLTACEAPAAKSGSPAATPASGTTPAAKQATPTLSTPAVKSSTSTPSTPAAKQVTPTPSTPAAKSSTPAAKPTGTPAVKPTGASAATPATATTPAAKQSTPAATTPAAKPSTPAAKPATDKPAEPRE